MQLELKNIEYTYSPGTVFAKTALDGINLQIKKGEYIALIGHTGSGKSTLISLMNALEKPTKGQVLFEGEDINAEDYDRKALRGKVGLVFQYPDHQLFETTILADVSFGPKNLGLSQEEVEKRARGALRLVGIDEKIFEDSPLELSGGQKKRVTIAGVLAMRPEVLILDEPTAGLDPAGRDEILEAISLIRENTGCTIVLVSHSMEDVAKHAERIVVLDKGKIIYDDFPEKVFAHHRELSEMGLSAPQVRILMDRLNEDGFSLNPDCITIDRAEEEILRFLNTAGNN